MPIARLNNEGKLVRPPNKDDEKFARSSSGLSVPISSLQPELQTPTLEQIIKFADAKPAQEIAVRPGSDVAIAVLNPKLFLANELRKDEKNNAPEVSEVLVHLLETRSKKDQKSQTPYSLAAISPSREARDFLDKDAQKKEQRQVSRVSAIEQVSISVVNIALEPTFRTMVVSHQFVRSILHVLREYRLACDNVRPEMPILTEHIIEQLQKTEVSEQLSAVLFDLLEEISIPDSMVEPLLQVSVSKKQLHHGFAFGLAARASSKEMSPFVREQQVKREEVLQQLQGTPQELFDNFPQLQAAARDLQLAEAIGSDSVGKVGMEIEFNNPQVAQLMPHGWEIHRETDLFEVTKNPVRDGAEKRGLELDSGYLKELDELSRWIFEMRANPGSIHLHFDLERHPKGQRLGLLFESATDIGDVIREGRGKDSVESRGLLVPTQHGRLDAATVANAMLLHTHAFAQDNHIGEKINADPLNLSFERAVWGHLCVYISSPAGRLAALLMLKNQLVFRAINPAAFMNSYTPTSFHPLAEAVQSKLGKTQQRLLGLLLKSSQDMAQWIQDTRNADSLSLMLELLQEREGVVPASVETALIQRFSRTEVSPIEDSILDFFLENPDAYRTSILYLFRLSSWRLRNKIYRILSDFPQFHDELLAPAMLEDQELQHAVSNFLRAHYAEHKVLINTLLHHKLEYLQVLAADILFGHGDELDQAELSMLEHHDNPDIRYDAVNFARNDREKLLTYLNDPAVKVRDLATKWLFERHVATRPMLIDRFRKDPDARHRFQTGEIFVGALSERDTDPSQWIFLLQDQDPEIRLRVVTSLARHTKKFGDLLKQATKDPNSRIQMFSTAILEKRELAEQHLKQEKDEAELLIQHVKAWSLEPARYSASLVSTLFAESENMVAKTLALQSLLTLPDSYIPQIAANFPNTKFERVDQLFRPLDPISPNTRQLLYTLCMDPRTMRETQLFAAATLARRMERNENMIIDVALHAPQEFARTAALRILGQDVNRYREVLSQALQDDHSMTNRFIAFEALITPSTFISADKPV